MDPFEAELRRITPAPPPADFLARLRAAQPTPRPAVRRPATIPALGLQHWLVRLLIPAAAMGVLGAVIWRLWLPTAPSPGLEPSAAAVPALKADDVQIDRELVASFDAVGRLPGGEPVRFRCREWIDQVVWEDKARGVVVEQRTPRVEIVPVRFETY